MSHWVEYIELLITAGDLVALSVEELVAWWAVDADTDTLTELDIELEFHLRTAGDGHAGAVDGGFTHRAVGLAGAVTQSLAFWACEGDALACSSAESLVDWALDAPAVVFKDVKTRWALDGNALAISFFLAKTAGKSETFSIFKSETIWAACDDAELGLLIKSLSFSAFDAGTGGCLVVADLAVGALDNDDALAVLVLVAGWALEFEAFAILELLAIWA
jgi:hypothetical protein